MARGWESKSVESQMDEAEERRRLTTEQDQRSAEQIRLLRVREGIELSKSRIVRELGETTHPRRHEQLSAALAHLDAQLNELDLPRKS